MIEREWYDVLLLCMLVVFLLLKALLIGRETRLGMSLSATNIVLSLSMLWSLALNRWPAVLLDFIWMVTVSRVCLLVCVTWCLYELGRARAQLWQTGFVAMAAIVSLFLLLNGGG